MKVLHITPAYKPAYVYGGPTMSVATLCEALANVGADVTVYTTTANGATELEVQPNVKQLVNGVPVFYFKRLTKDHTHYSPALLKALRKKGGSFDLIHIHAWWNLPSVLSARVGQQIQVPVLISPRGMLSDYSFKNNNSGAKALLHRFLGKKLLQKSHIHATSQHEANAVNGLVATVSVNVLPNFVDLPGLNIVTSPEDANVFRIIFFSRIHEKKGLELLLDALQRTDIAYHLTIAGDGDPEYIERLKEASDGINDNITWAGFVSDEKFKLLAKHDLFVLPSYDENFANVVIESLSVGTAVLISDQVGLADYIKINNLGFTCQTNAASVAQEIKDIALHRRDALKKIRDIAPTRVRADFTGNALAQRYIELYQQVIDTNS